jgi:hypothetical protein
MVALISDINGLFIVNKKPKWTSELISSIALSISSSYSDTRL